MSWYSDSALQGRFDGENKKKAERKGEKFMKQTSSLLVCPLPIDAPLKHHGIRKKTSSFSSR